MEELKVKYFTDKIDELCYVAGKSDWIDLHAAEEVTLKAGELRLIPLEPNARICQFRIMQNQPPLRFTRVERLEGPDRGGFGSTGK